MWRRLNRACVLLARRAVEVPAVRSVAAHLKMDRYDDALASGLAGIVGRLPSRTLRPMPPRSEGQRAPASTNGTPRDRRTDVIHAAVALFAERGYKETTATEIAERAGVSRRAFFYYFRSKDDVLFGVDQAALDHLTELAAEQPRELSDLEACEAAWVAFGDDRRSRVVQLRQAAESSPVLRGKELELHLAYERALASGLARRRGLHEPDTIALVAAGMGQALMHLVVDRWVVDPKSDRMELIKQYFSAAREALASP
jgi:AcrR family transcriptional regulator